MPIVLIRRNGNIDGYQVRLGVGGPGNSKFFAAKKHGGAAEALEAAKRLALDHAIPLGAPAGGSVEGRVLKTSRTKAAGIRFVWTPARSGSILRVVATWTDRSGRVRSTSYSVEKNGLSGALDLAIAARTTAGAPALDRDELLKLLSTTYRTGAPVR